jgi:hypothetical protein
MKFKRGADAPLRRPVATGRDLKRGHSPLFLKLPSPARRTQAFYDNLAGEGSGVRLNNNPEKSKH